MIEVSVEATGSSSPEAVYGLVADVTNMGRWRPETRGCRWSGKLREPSVGAKFRGRNRRGWRRWSTTCTVTAAEPGKRFAFDVHLGPLAIADWSYDFVPDGTGCRVRESWRDKRPGWMLRLDPKVMGISDRAQHNRETMEATLGRLGEACG